MEKEMERDGFGDSLVGSNSSPRKANVGVKEKGAHAKEKVWMQRRQAVEAG